MPEMDRDTHEFEREIASARADLAARLAKLEHTVHEKIAIKDRARVIAAKAKQRAMAGFDAAGTDIKAHPVRYGSILGGLLLVAGAILVLRAKHVGPFA